MDPIWKWPCFGKPGHFPRKDPRHPRICPCSLLPKGLEAGTRDAGGAVTDTHRDTLTVMYSQALTRHTQPQLCMQTNAATQCHTPTYSPIDPTECSLLLTGLPYPMAPLPAPHAPRLCCLCPQRTQRPCPPVASPSPQKGLGHPRTRGWWPRLTGLVAEVGGHTGEGNNRFFWGASA